MAKTDLPEAIQSKIQGMLDAKDTVLFMKGQPALPQCGFSAQVVQVLKSIGVEFDAHNVLADPEIRQGIKVFADWPTIPQLYYKGEFVGGCDIVTQMAQSGDLQKTLGLEA